MNNKSTKQLQALMAAILLASGTGGATIFGGVDFPDGAISFADRVHRVVPGDPGPTNANFQDPSKVLGVPNYTGGSSGTGAFTLGNGGLIEVQFLDNRLTGDGTSAPDLHIFEVGPDVEDTFVYISELGIRWTFVGKVFGSTSSIDIDPFIGGAFATEFAFVRLIDDPGEGGTTGATPGADIDAVGAIATRKATPQECMTTSEGRPAVLRVTKVFEMLPGVTRIDGTFNGTIVEGYCYLVEFTTDLENWVKVREGGAEDFVPGPLGTWQTAIVLDSFLAQFIDLEKAKRLGYVRLKISEKPPPGGG